MQKLNQINKNENYELKNDGLIYFKNKPYAYYICFDNSKETPDGCEASVECYSTGLKVTSVYKGEKRICYYTNTGRNAVMISGNCIKDKIFSKNQRQSEESVKQQIPNKIIKQEN